MQKLNLAQANALFKALKADIQVDADVEDDNNVNVNTLKDGIFDGITEVLRAEVVESTRDAARKEFDGKTMGSLRTILKREFGLEEKDMSEKNMGELMKIASEKAKSTYSSSEGASKEWEKAYNDIKAEKETLEQNLRTEFENEKSSLLNNITRQEKERIIRAKLDTYPLREGVSKDRLISFVMKDMDENYDTKIDEDKTIKFFKKGTGDIPAFSEGKLPLTDELYIKESINSLGIIEKDNRNTPPASQTGGGSNYTPPHDSKGDADQGDVMEFINNALK